MSIRGDLLAHSHAQSFTFVCNLLSPCKGRSEPSSQRPYGQQNIFCLALYRKYLPTSDLIVSDSAYAKSTLCCSVAQSCLTLCDPMDCSTPGFPVHHQLPELAETHIHWAGDAIQPSHPLLSSSPPAFNLSQHQGLFQWVSALDIL